MIVKIWCDGKWDFYDGFVNVDYENFPTDKFKEEKRGEIDYRAKTEGDKGLGAVLIWCYKEYSKHQRPTVGLCIKANTMIYLCNDEGKTIERIN